MGWYEPIFVVLITLGAMIVAGYGYKGIVTLWRIIRKCGVVA